MANYLFDDGREGFLDGSIDWDTDDIRCAACSSAYSASQSGHKFLSSVTNIQGTSATLTNPTVTDGVADADDAAWTSLAGSAVSQFILYKHTGTAGTSRLIAHIDTYTGLPYTPTGGNLVVIWPNGSLKIFKL